LHLLLEPERQADLFHLAEEFVRGTNTQTRRHDPRGQSVVDQGVTVLTDRQVLEEIAADELLRERRSTLGETRPEPIAPPPCCQRMKGGFLDHPRKRAILHAGVGEEVLVLGRQDGLAQDEGHLVVGDNPAVLSRQLDQDFALVVVDLADPRGFETDEGLDVGEVVPVEVDVADDTRHRQKRQQYQ
jgi:hypothetical protein